jgi:hypothetical protein
LIALPHFHVLPSALVVFTRSYQTIRQQTNSRSILNATSSTRHAALTPRTEGRPLNRHFNLHVESSLDSTELVLSDAEELSLIRLLRVVDSHELIVVREEEFFSVLIDFRVVLKGEQGIFLDKPIQKENLRRSTKLSAQGFHQLCSLS